MNEHYYALILAGGGGTRLWPKSVEKRPKQFLKLGGEHTLLRSTAERVSTLIDWDHIYVITNESQYADVLAQLPEVPADHIISEPMKRETAMAMAVGALVIAQRDPNAVVMNFASDHVVGNLQEFTHVLLTAAKEAEDQQHLVAVGITPTYPHTGLGYIQVGQKLRDTDSLPVYQVQSFREKPDLATATAFVASGQYYWNANNYTWSSAAVLAAFQKYAPKTYAALQQLQAHIGQPDFAEALRVAYDSVDAISIDYAISEKADNLLLLPGDFGWNDIGDWNVVYELGKKDTDGNVILHEDPTGAFHQINSKNNLVYTNGRMVALVGMEDCVVVDTPQTVLVMPRQKSQDIKKLVAVLKEQKSTEYL